MAFEDENFKDYRIYFSSDNDNAEFAAQVQSMTWEGCSVVLGLFTSKDCLIAGPILKENKTIGLSPSCAVDKIKQFMPYLYSATPDLDNFSKKVAERIDDDVQEGVVFAFYQPSDIYSTSGYKAFKKNVNKKIIEVPVNSSGEFDSKLLSVVANNKSSMVFFTNPLPSAQILVNLDRHKLITKNVKIIGATSWVFDISVFKPVESVLLKANSVMSPTVINRDQIESSIFSQHFRKLYGREPDVVEVLSYDATRLAVQCYRHTLSAGSEDKNQSFIQCLRMNKYNGVSGHSVFEEGSPFSVRKVSLVNFLARVQ